MNKVRLYKNRTFKHTITLEDIADADQYPEIEVYNGEDFEQILDLSDYDFRYPNMGYSFSTKITSVNSSLLGRIARDLLYFNQYIPESEYSKMAEFIIGTMVSFKNKKPLISNEQIQRVIKKVRNNFNFVEWEPESTRLILFSKYSKLSKADKKTMALQMRVAKNQKLKEAMIHNMAEYLIESTELVKITDKSVHAKLEYVKGFKTLRSVRKHMSKRTINMLESISEYRYFTTEKDMMRFILYNEMLDMGLTTKRIVSELGTSYSTLSRYSELNEILKLDGIKLD